MTTQTASWPNRYPPVPWKRTHLVGQELLQSLHVGEHGVEHQGAAGAQLGQDVKLLRSKHGE